MTSKPSLQAARKTADLLYEKLCSGPPEKLYDQSTLSSFCSPRPTPYEFLQIIQRLIDNFQLSVHSSHSETLWKCVLPGQASKLKALGLDEGLVYRQIEAVQNVGIWKRDLQRKTNLHLTSLDRCLKTLEVRGYIKTVKSVQYQSRKIYMLAHLDPAEDISGGSWYEDGELDVAFIEYMRKAVFKSIQDESFQRIEAATDPTDDDPGIHGEWPMGATSQLFYPHPAGFTGYATLAHVTQCLKKSKVINVSLMSGEIQQIIDDLCWDGKVVRMGNGRYKAKLIPTESLKVGNGLTDAPCGRCPAFDLCEEGGPVDASNCEYLDKWLHCTPVS